MPVTELARQTLEVARAELAAGVHEIPPGSNTGPRIKIYQAFLEKYAGASAYKQPWCAAFCAWSIYHAGHFLGMEPKFVKSPSSSAIYRWAKRTGNLLAYAEAGCVALLIGGSTGHSHTYLSERVDGAIVHTIEGNISNKIVAGTRPVSAAHYVRIV